MLAKVSRPTLVDEVVAALRQMLKKGDFAQGMRLPGENDLARQLGVGRSTVREALRTLSHLGIVEARSGLGTFVVRSSSDMSPAWVRPSETDLLELYEFRLGMERTSAALAAERRSPIQIERIRAAWARAVPAIESGDPAEFAKVDFGFHMSIIEASGNRLMIESYRGLEARFVGTVTYILGLGQLGSMRNFHDGLIEAIARQDADAAMRIVDGDFLQARVRLRLSEVND